MPIEIYNTCTFLFNIDTGTNMWYYSLWIRNRFASIATGHVVSTLYHTNLDCDLNMDASQQLLNILSVPPITIKRLKRLIYGGTMDMEN